MQTTEFEKNLDAHFAREAKAFFALGVCVIALTCLARVAGWI